MELDDFRLDDDVPPQVEVPLLLEPPQNWSAVRLTGYWVTDNALSVGVMWLPGAHPKGPQPAAPNNQFEIVRWAQFEPEMARFISATHLVFSDLQRKSEQAAERNEDLRGDLALQASVIQQYRTTFEQQLMYLRTLLPHDTTGRVAPLCSRFDSIRSIWLLHESLHVATTGAEPCNQAYLRWLAIGRPVAYETLSDKSMALKTAVLRGDRDQAVRSLDALDVRSETAAILRSALLDMPMRDDSAPFVGGDYKDQIRRWQDRLASRQPRQAPTDTFAMLLQCLLGDLPAMERIGGGQWENVLAGLLMYVHPSVSTHELRNHLEAVGLSEEGDIDAPLSSQIEVAMMQGNRTRVMQLASRYDPWLVAHLADLYHHFFGEEDVIRGSATVFQEPTASFREHFTAQYGSTLLQHPSLWRTGADYLGSSGPMGLAMLAELITHVSLDSERKLAKVVDVCRAYRLTDSAKTVHKIYARKCRSRGHLGAAALHFMSADAMPELKRVVHTLAVEFFERKDDPAYYHVLSSLADYVQTSDQLAFLPDYLRFHAYYAKQEFAEAKQVLSLLIRNGGSPLKFMPVLLLDALPLLEGNEVTFDADETYEMMRALEQVLTSHRKGEFLRKMDPAELEPVRLALVRNLARAFLRS